jgi:hypothetical protein
MISPDPNGLLAPFRAYYRTLQPLHSSSWAYLHVDTACGAIQCKCPPRCSAEPCRKPRPDEGMTGALKSRALADINPVKTTLNPGP